MLKIRPPYSLLIGALVAIYNLPIGLLAGALSEAFFCILLFWKLRSEEEFNYESVYGQLLSQMTISAEIYIWDILHIAMARITSYVLSATVLLSWSMPFIYSVVGTLSPLWLIPPAALFLYSITHKP